MDEILFINACEKAQAFKLTKEEWKVITEISLCSVIEIMNTSPDYIKKSGYKEIEDSKILDCKNEIKRFCNENAWNRDEFTFSGIFHPKISQMANFYERYMEELESEDIVFDFDLFNKIFNEIF